MTLQNAEDDLGIPYLVNCSKEEDQKCVLDIVRITDKSIPAEEKVQVLITGGLHGTDRLGTQIAVYLVEYFTSNFKKDAFITSLLQRREIVIVPMPNAYGYATEIAFEKCKTPNSFLDSFYDPSSDFPYNNDASNCLKTVTARTLYRLMVDNLFVASLSFDIGFEGSDQSQSLIAYPWGSKNHRQRSSSTSEYESNEAPDFKAFKHLSLAMKEQAGPSRPFIEDMELISEYSTGDVTTVIESLNGQFNDWAYAAGWDDSLSGEAVILECAPSTEPALDSAFYEQADLKVASAAFRILADSELDPAEATYGSREIVFDDPDNLDTSDFQVLVESVVDLDIQKDFNGHINRNIRLSTAMIDMAKPYIWIDAITAIKEDGEDLLQV